MAADCSVRARVSDSAARVPTSLMGTFDLERRGARLTFTRLRPGLPERSASASQIAWECGPATQIVAGSMLHRRAKPMSAESCRRIEASRRHAGRTSKGQKPSPAFPPGCG